MKAILITVAALALSPAAFASDVIEVRPGQWISSTQISMGGNPLQTDEQSYCVSPAEATRSVESLVKDITEDGSCTVENLSHSSGNLSADMTCKIEDMGAQASGKLVGVYTKESYSLTADATIDLGGLQLPAKAESTAKWVGECEAD